MGNGRHSGLAKGIKDVTKKVKSYIGDKVIRAFSGKHDEADIKSTYMENANPHRDDWMQGKNVPYYRFRENCQRVAVAQDLRLAGYDVEALGTHRGDDHGWFHDSNPVSYKKAFNNAQWDMITASNSIGAEAQIAKLLPDVGARCLVRIRWNGGGGHVFNIVRTEKGLLGIDGQVNKTFEVQKYLKDGMYDRSMHILVTNKGGGTSDLYTPNETLMPEYLKRHRIKGGTK